jgi:hypothetical protein
MKDKPDNGAADGGRVPALVGLVESAIGATAGRMFLDIHIDDELTESITAMITEEIGYGNPDEVITVFVIRRVFGNHEERLVDAARDDANCGMAHALRSLPNAKEHPPADDAAGSRAQTSN